MQDCSAKLFYTVIIDISMVVENGKILGIAEKLYIDIYYPSNLLIFLLNNYIIYHSVVSKNVIVLSMFDCL